MIRAVGFGDFLDSLEVVPRRSPGVSATLAEFWWDTTNSFHLAFGEMTLTPLDVYALTGIPVGGLPIQIERESYLSDAAIRNALGPGLLPDGSGRSFRLSKLKKHLEKRSKDMSTELLIRQYARTLMLFVLGLLCANGGEVVHSWFLSYLMDFTVVAQYDWGGLVLADCYASMTSFSRLAVDRMNGFSYLWEVSKILFISSL